MSRIDTIKKLIKHPFFQYAYLDTENGDVIIKTKSFCLFWKTFGKRIVAIKIAHYERR